MCVCIYKPAGIKMPTKKTLSQCHTINPDGMGFCTPESVYHTMSFKSFWDALKVVPKDESCILHFRWATHGSVKVENCHPFAIGNVKFAHNGVLPIPSVNDMTDSEIAFRKVVYPAIKKFGFKSQEADLIIEAEACGSRFAIMDGDDVELFGHWYNMGGVYYSNLNWLRC